MMFWKRQTKETDGQSPHIEPMRAIAPAVDESSTLRGRVLVAEDAQCMQRFIRSILGKINIETEMAENGQMACDLAQNSMDEGNPYDLILMDMQMPTMNGYEATRWLRKHDWSGPIVAVTAHDLGKVRNKCMDAGCDDCLSKPITETALWNVVTRHLDGSIVNQRTKTTGTLLS